MNMQAFLWRKRWFSLGALAGILSIMLSACQSSSLIDKHYEARGQDSRVRYVVLHYTWENKADSFDILTKGAVSAHYLITDDEPAQIWQLVDENRRAWHAGESSWYGATGINTGSIGIEIVNLGAREQGTGIPESPEQWQAFTPSQMERLTALLKDIVKRHKIKPENIVAHSDIAPQRKIDPGPRFDWQQLAKEGLGRWYDAAQVQVLTERYQNNGLPEVAWVQEQLSRLGYALESSGILDAQTHNVLRAFQMRYRPTRYDGQIDAQTAAILQNLVERQ